MTDPTHEARAMIDRQSIEQCRGEHEHLEGSICRRCAARALDAFAAKTSEKWKKLNDERRQRMSLDVHGNVVNPTPGAENPLFMPAYPGHAAITLRDLFAAAALAGMGCGISPAMQAHDLEGIARVAYATADAMLGAREGVLGKKTAQ